MKRFFLRHKVRPEDITHLSDTDSKFIIETKSLNEEDMIEIATINELFLAQITFIDTASVEIEIIKKIGNIEAPVETASATITMIQAVSNDSKFNFFLEKSVEIGVDKIIPIHSEYCLLDKKDAQKKEGLWEKVILDATEQSRNPNPPILLQTTEIADLPSLIGTTTGSDTLKICLATEQVSVKTLSETIKTGPQYKNTTFIVAIGPEKGWSISDIEVLKKLGFKFVTLGKNILRTETAGLVIASILRFAQNKY